MLKRIENLILASDFSALQNELNTNLENSRLSEYVFEVGE